MLGLPLGLEGGSLLRRLARSGFLLHHSRGLRLLLLLLLLLRLLLRLGLLLGLGLLGLRGFLATLFL